MALRRAARSRRLHAPPHRRQGLACLRDRGLSFGTGSTLAREAGGEVPALPWRDLGHAQRVGVPHGLQLLALRRRVWHAEQQARCPRTRRSGGCKRGAAGRASSACVACCCLSCWLERCTRHRGLLLGCRSRSAGLSAGAWCRGSSSICMAAHVSPLRLRRTAGLTSIRSMHCSAHIQELRHCHGALAGAHLLLLAAACQRPAACHPCCGPCPGHCGHGLACRLPTSGPWKAAGLPAGPAAPAAARSGDGLHAPLACSI